LKFSVFVNDKVKTFNVSGGLEWSLEKLKTDVPVNVSVVLSKAFPPSTVTITRYILLNSKILVGQLLTLLI